MILCVVGPTGVGKTKLSVELAKHYNAVVLNGDSMQVYKELNIGTAKVTEEEKEGIEHLLFDIVEPTDMYTVYDYQKDLRRVLEDNKDKNIVIVGGTGLYLKAALYNYVFTEEENNETYDDLTNEELYELVMKKDSNCDIHVNNRKRMIRFLNREENIKDKDKLLYDVKFIGLTTDREYLYERINERVLVMFGEGLICEVKDLINKYGITNILKRAIGYKEVIMYLNNEITKEDCIELIQKNSRHYAKRQYTWFNNKMDINWFDVDFNNFHNTYVEVLKYLEKQ